MCLDRNNLLEPFRQRQSEQAHARVKVNRHAAGFFSRHRGHQLRQQKARALEKCRRADSIGKFPNTIGEVRLAENPHACILSDGDGCYSRKFGKTPCGERFGFLRIPAPVERQHDFFVAIIRQKFHLSAIRQLADPRLAAQCREQRVQARGQNRAGIDGNQAVRIGLEKSQTRSAAGRAPDFQLRLVAIIPRRAGMRGNGPFPFHLAQPSQRFPQDFGFCGNLRGVYEMLILAAATAAEVWARGFYAPGRRLQNPQRVRMNDAFLPAEFLHFGALARQNAWRENGAPSMEAQRLAAVNQLDR